MPECLGFKVTCRVEVGTDVLEVHAGLQLVARHRLCPGATEPVWDPAHRSAAEAIALGRSHPGLRVVRTLAEEPTPPSQGRLDLGEGDYDVEEPDSPPATAAAGAADGGPDMTENISPYEQLKNDLGYLQLGRAAECFATLADQAKAESWSHVEFLARVMAEQALATTNRRLAARLRYARFPYRRSIEDFDFDFQPSVDRKLVADLASLRFITEGRSIAFLGQPGRG